MGGSDPHLYVGGGYGGTRFWGQGRQLFHNGILSAARAIFLLPPLPLRVEPLNRFAVCSSGGGKGRAQGCRFRLTVRAANRAALGFGMQPLQPVQLRIPQTPIALIAECPDCPVP